MRPLSFLLMSGNQQENDRYHNSRMAEVLHVVRIVATGTKKASSPAPENDVSSI